MIKKNGMVLWMSAIVTALLLFSCGWTFDIETYEGNYLFVSSNRKNDYSETELTVDFQTESKFRVEVVSSNPQDLYGENFLACTPRSYTLDENNSVVGVASWYCYFFDDCQLSEYDLRFSNLGEDSLHFNLFTVAGDGGTQIDWLVVYLSYINKSAGTIRARVVFQSYTAIFEN